MLVIGSTAFAQEKPLQKQDLPLKAIEFLDSFTNDKQISSIEIDKEFLSKEYEVNFTDKSEVEFDMKGNLKEFKAKKSGISKEVLPSNIAAFISENYPDLKILKIDKKGKKYKVTLENDLKLEFNRKEKLVK